MVVSCGEKTLSEAGAGPGHGVIFRLWAPKPIVFAPVIWTPKTIVLAPSKNVSKCVPKDTSEMTSFWGTPVGGRAAAPNAKASE